MIYLIGGAPRSGKSTLAQHLAGKLGCGWVATDLLVDLLRVAAVPRVPQEWNAAPNAITAVAEWFSPYLKQFIWGAGSLAENYVVEGVAFLPAQVVDLSAQHDICAVFLGNAGMTLNLFDRFPGHSVGYASLPEKMRRQFANDVPRWSDFVRREAVHHDLPYVDMSGDFYARLEEAEALLLGA